MSLSKSQFGGQTITKEGVMPEDPKMDGPAVLKTSGMQNMLAAHANTPLPSPGFLP